jgi:hypothetical protein
MINTPLHEMTIICIIWFKILLFLFFCNFTAIEVKALVVNWKEKRILIRDGIISIIVGQKIFTRIICIFLFESFRLSPRLLSVTTEDFIMFTFNKTQCLSFSKAEFLEFLNCKTISRSSHEKLYCKSFFFEPFLT